MENAERKPKKPYSNAYRSLEAIWQVLRRHASRQHPLTVREICGYLKDMEEAPSLDTLERLLPRGLELMNLLFPGQALQEGKTPPADTWLDADGLHIALETPAGEVREDLCLQAAREPFRAPSYSTVEKLLSYGIPLDLDTFPFRLRCVAQLPGKEGRLVTIPYEKWEDSFPPDKARSNNVPRRYYLQSVLSEAEWRLFSDLILVYPFLSENQTKRFLRVLNKFRPKPVYIPSRFAFKRGSQRQMEVVAQLDQAIQKKKKVRLLYGEHRLEKQPDGTWRPVLSQRRSSGELEVEPYALMWSNGNYYLIARHRGMMNLRADRILGVERLEEGFTIPPDFDLVGYRNSCPVMYPGEKRFVHLRCSTGLVNTLLDFFGDLPQYTAPAPAPGGGETTEVTMSIAPAGVKLFALQYAGSVEVLEPRELREEIARELEAALKKYRS